MVIKIWRGPNPKNEKPMKDSIDYTLYTVTHSITHCKLTSGRSTTPSAMESPLRAVLYITLSVFAFFSILVSSTSPNHITILNAERRVSFHFSTTSFWSLSFLVLFELIFCNLFICWDYVCLIKLSWFWVMAYLLQIDLTSHIVKVFLTLKVFSFLINALT